MNSRRILGFHVTPQIRTVMKEWNLPIFADKDSSVESTIEAVKHTCNLRDKLSRESLYDTLLERRSRRFGLGMQQDSGPMKYASRHDPMPLCPKEEAALAFAACGITGHALADLVYEQGEGGTMMAGFLGRTVSSADAVQSVTMFMTNDSGTWMLKRPQDFEPAEIADVVDLAQNGELEELDQRSRILIKPERTAPDLSSPTNLDCNRWDLYAKGSTYFVPVNDYTYMYINGVLEFLNETMGIFIVDERANMQPAGLAKFGKSRGGHLDDDPHAMKTITVERLESILKAVVSIEQGMMLQNLGLMAQAIGVGGFPNFAGHEFAWLNELGFRQQQMRAVKYFSGGRFTNFMATCLGRNPQIEFPVGLEVDGEPLLKPYCPPYYASMADAVMAVVERKFGPQGIFRGSVSQSAWKDPGAIRSGSKKVAQATIDATIAYCEYLYHRYGRFPVYPAPYSTSVGFQANHLDLEFYDKFYRREAVSESHRQHMARWHGDEADARSEHLHRDESA